MRQQIFDVIGWCVVAILVFGFFGLIMIWADKANGVAKYKPKILLFIEN